MLSPEELEQVLPAESAFPSPILSINWSSQNSAFRSLPRTYAFTESMA